MQHTTKHAAPWYGVLLVSLGILVFGQFWFSQTVRATEVELVGYVTAKPARSSIGLGLSSNGTPLSVQHSNRFLSMMKIAKNRQTTLGRVS